MKTKLINSQMTNFKTYLMYKQQCEMTAENVFQIEDLPEDCVIDMSYVNSQLLSNGSIAWFVDEEMGLLALPYISMSGFDVYGRPVRIQVIGQNGYSRILKRGEFVIMYDNASRYPIYADIVQMAERIALCVKTNDVNIKGMYEIIINNTLPLNVFKNIVQKLSIIKPKTDKNNFP